MKKFMLLCLLLTGIVIPTHADPLLYTVSNGSGVLMTIDPSTLALNTVGPLGVAFDFGALAYDSANSTLYMIDGRGAKSLYTVNMTTGAATLVGSHGLTDLFGLAFDSSNSTMYASQFIANTPLEKLNLGTGAPTAVGTDISATDRIGSLAWDSTNSTLYGFEQCITVGCAKLFTIDPASGVGTVFNSSGLESDNSGLTYDPVLNRLWNVDVAGKLSYFDPATGAQTFVNTYGTSLDGLAFVNTAPEPGSLVLLASGAIGILASFRRRLRLPG